MLWFGLAAMAMNAVAGMNHVRPTAGANGLSTLEICTLRGIIKLDPVTMAPIEGQSPTPHDSAKPGCCDLCGACSVAAVADVNPLAAINVVVTGIDSQAPPASCEFAAPHPALTPLVPRGPPARA
jgi:hypothetical protein